MIATYLRYVYWGLHLGCVFVIGYTMLIIPRLVACVTVCHRYHIQPYESTCFYNFTPSPDSPVPPFGKSKGAIGFLKQAQWLSGRELDLRPRGSGFEPHRRHCVVVLEQDTFILA